MKENHYIVSWEIDEFAETPEEAAYGAFNHMQSPTSATVFTVKNTDTGEVTRIDLLEGREEENL